MASRKFNLLLEDDQQEIQSLLENSQDENNYSPPEESTPNIVILSDILIRPPTLLTEVDYGEEAGPSGVEENSTLKDIFNIDSDSPFDDSDKDPDFVSRNELRDSPLMSDEGDDNITDKENEIMESSYNQSETLLARWKKSNPGKWKKNLAKRQRSFCEPYTTLNVLRPKKHPKPIDCSTCHFKCNLKFSPDDRNILCKTYWALDYNRQHDFILSNVTAFQVKRKTNVTTSRPREVSKQYTFLKNGIKQRVCKSFFEKTLCISNGPVITAFKGQNETGVFTKSDKRGKKPPGNKKSEAEMAIVRQHIESFPTMEAHYVRKSSKRKYLDKNLSILKMYQLYKEYCKGKSVNPISESGYRHYFCSNFNLSFFRPKKDQCPLCTRYETPVGQVQREALEPEYKMHISRKNECNASKENDKVRAKEDSTFITATFDLQSVLQIPKSDVSPFYYSRKICVYNLTIYEGASGKGHCYCWTEVNGKPGSSEVGSVLFKWIQSLPSQTREISVFSDTCGGQNRNRNVAALFLYAVIELANIDVIEHKFLESGHTFMECDSMHSAIESEAKNKSIYGLSGWMEVFKNARSTRGKIKHSPYEVNEMKFYDFKDLQSLSSKLLKNRLKDENGETVNWLKIKSMRYEKNNPGVILIRYDHSSSYVRLNAYGRKSVPRLDLSPLYKKVLPISCVKKQDLWKLCNNHNIPEEYHGWYSQLPVDKKIRNCDSLPEPDAYEDTDTEEEV